MMCHFAGRTTKAVPVGIFQRSVLLSVPSTIPSRFINSQVHILSFLRYSSDIEPPARAADIRTWRVTLFLPAFRLAIYLITAPHFPDRTAFSKSHSPLFQTIHFAEIAFDFLFSFSHSRTPLDLDCRFLP